MGRSGGPSFFALPASSVPISVAGCAQRRPGQVPTRIRSTQAGEGSVAASARRSSVTSLPAPRACRAVSALADFEQARPVVSSGPVCPCSSGPWSPAIRRDRSRFGQPGHALCYWRGEQAPDRPSSKATAATRLDILHSSLTGNERAASRFHAPFEDVAARADEASVFVARILVARMSKSTYGMAIGDLTNCPGSLPAFAKPARRAKEGCSDGHLATAKKSSASMSRS